MIVLFLWAVCGLYQAFTGEIIIKDEGSMLIALVGESVFEFVIALSRDKDQEVDDD